jgi:hypothetical protein
MPEGGGVLANRRPYKVLHLGDLASVESLHAPEVQEDHRSIAPEQVVARVRAGVERVEPAKAPMGGALACRRAIAA